MLRLGERARRSAAGQRRERRDAPRRRRPIAKARPERAVSRAPIVPAASGAVGLVHGDEGDPASLGRAAQRAAEGGRVQPLGRGEREGQTSGGQLRQPAPRGLRIVADEKADAPHSRFGQAPRLIAQKRAQRRHDESRPRHEQRSQLKDQGLSGAGRQRQHQVASFEKSREAVRLPRTQARRAEEPARERGERRIVANERRRRRVQDERLRRLAAVENPRRAPSRLDGGGPRNEQRSALGRLLLRIQPPQFDEEPPQIAARSLREPRRLVRRECAQTPEVGVEPRGKSRRFGQNGRALQAMRGARRGRGAGAETGAQFRFEFRRERHQRAAIQQPPRQGAREAAVLRRILESERPPRPRRGVRAPRGASRSANGRGRRARRLHENLHTRLTGCPPKKFPGRVIHENS